MSISTVRVATVSQFLTFYRKANCCRIIRAALLLYNSFEELADFAALMAIGKPGEGECSAIVAVQKHNLALAIDDKAAGKKESAFHPAIQLLDTAELHS